MCYTLKGLSQEDPPAMKKILSISDIILFTNIHLGKGRA